MTGKESGLISFALAIGALIIGGQYWERPQYKKRFFYVDWDKVFFRNSHDEKILLKGDKLIFIICIIIAALIFINGILAYFFNVPTICILLMPICIFLGPIRMIYIYSHSKSLSSLEKKKFKNIPAANEEKNEG